MGGEKNSGTNYTSLEVFKKREKRSIQHGDKYMSAPIPLKISFDSNFDEFVAKVAYALRHKIVYRTDGGKFARGLIRSSGELKIIHDYYIGSTPPENGGTINLTAIMLRRKDPSVHERWVMIIYFNAPDILDEEKEDIVASQALTDYSIKNWVDRIIDEGIFAVQSLPQSNIHTNRISCMLKIAERMGYPRNENLWYYNRDAVIEYVQWRTTDARRKSMTQATYGLSPFKGDIYPHGEWRIYPFKAIANKCWGNNPDDCRAKIVNELISAEDYIMRTFQDINKELNKAAVFNVIDFSLFTPAQLKLLGAQVNDFLKHLYKLQNDRDHLYSCFK